ncbi:MAG: hypothetical protein JNL01_00830 [Bdellovibrionales bacterium]|nr:hypothetical protein [Bdellovibrionales bacterium]
MSLILAPAALAAKAGKAAAKKTDDAPTSSYSSHGGSKLDGNFRLSTTSEGLDLSTSSAGSLTFVDFGADAGWILPSGLEFGLLFSIKSLSAGGTVTRFFIVPEASFNFGGDSLNDAFFTRLGLGLSIVAGSTDFVIRPVFGKRIELTKKISWSPELAIGLVTASAFTVNIAAMPISLTFLF